MNAAVALGMLCFGQLKAGAFAVDISPPLPISLNGGMSDRQAAIIHDPLHARCLVLESGSVLLAIVVVDSCAVPTRIAETAKQLIQADLNIPPDRVTISATHTHSAPTLAPAFQSLPLAGYAEDLPKRIALGVRNAYRQREPAKLGWARAEEPNQVFNRRWKLKPGTIPPNPFGVRDQVQMNPGVGNPNLVEPAGPTDPEIVALSVRAADDRPIAAFANYSLHYVGDVRGDAVSADYFGEFARRLAHKLGAERVGPRFVGAMTNGTSGNINNINFRTAHPKTPAFGRIELVAEECAKAIAPAISQTKYRADVSLAAATKTLTLGVRKPSADDLKRAERILAGAQGRTLRNLEEIYAGETRDLAKYPDTMPVTIQAVRIGEVGMVAIPCEVFVEIGLDLKKRSPLKPTYVTSLANGYAGYLPTAEHHRLGGYETWAAKSSYLEVAAAEKITATALELLQQVAEKR